MKYKEYHEKYMKNTVGTSAYDTYLLILPAFFEMFLSTITFTYLLNKLKIKLDQYAQMLQFIIDFTIIIFPIILTVTIMSKHAALLLQTLIILNLCTLFLIVNSSYTKTVNRKPKNEDTRRSYITNFRSTINIITAVAILAVDFKIFPRKFAKTERYGYSLMDVGVGLFIYSNGAVAPEITNKKKSFKKSLSGTIPLLILGVARFIITNEIDYQVPVSEYGVHWNFFITLAVTKLISAVILKFASANRSLYIAGAVLLLHELLLYAGGAQWVFRDVPRNDLISANREGIISSLGYVGLYFMSVYFGMIIKSSMAIKNDTKLVTQLFLGSVALFIVMVNLDSLTGTSRKLVNLSYCSWIMFIGISMTTLFVGGEIFLKYLYRHSILRHQIYAPIICEAVNYNQLVFFLLSNVFTGIVNISIKTLYVETFLSIVILNVYMFVLCFITCLLYVNKIKMKFW